MTLVFFRKTICVVCMQILIISPHAFAGKVKGKKGSVEREIALVNRVKEQGSQMVDRRNLEELVKEWKLGMFGYVDSASAQQAGNLLGVDIFCLGRYTYGGDKINLRVSLINSETGQILGGTTGDIIADSSIKELSAKFLKLPADSSSADEPENAALKVDLWSDKEEYKIGEKMKVYVKANQDCYLTLIDVGTSGNATVIFPNHYAPRNAVEAGVTYTVPDPSAGFEFEVGEPAGIEIIRAIASKEPAIDLKEAMESFSIENPFGSVKQPAVLTRDIHVKAKKAKKDAWSETVLRLTIQ